MFRAHVLVTLRWALRDRLLHGVLGSALALLLLTPAFSLFSMRQVQELAITLCLSLQALVLLVLVLLLGGFSLWREVDRRYTLSVLTFPVPRSSFVLGRFAGIVIFLTGTSFLLAGISAVVVVLSRFLYPSEVLPQWDILALAATGMLGKFILLAGVALLLSSVSTSFFLPFFGTLAIYLAGSASQQVYDYLSLSQTVEIGPVVQVAAKIFYFLIPNFSIFDFKIQAIYGLSVGWRQPCLAVLYLVFYSGLCLFLAVWSFSRRQFP